jgi:hypothetical protein
MRFPFGTPRLLAALVLLASACRTLEEREPAGADSLVVHRAVPTRAWNALAGGEVVGIVILFEDRGGPQHSLYVVRNPWHQDLGMIDSLGRAYRFLPHGREPAWIGTGSVALGAERILQPAAEVHLVEVPVPSPDEVSPGAPPQRARSERHDLGAPPAADDDGSG